MKLKQGHVLMAGCVVLFFIALLLIRLEYYGQPEDIRGKMTVGVLLQGGFEEPGWNHRNYAGIREAAGVLGLQLDSHENCKAGSQETAETIYQMEQADRMLVVLASADYLANMKAARDCGFQMVFAVPSLEQPPDKQCIPYFVRLYQGEYLAGILAGMHTKSGHIGYVASMSVPETVRCIDAFMLGVRRVNSQADVTVHWIGSWDDADKEIRAAYDLIEKTGVDVINSHQDRAYVQQTAEKCGIDYFSYQDPVQGGSQHNLAMLSCDWSVVYREILQDYQQGQLRELYWAGLTEGAVDLVDYSSAVDMAERQTLEQARQEIRHGQTIFSGTIRDIHGVERCAAEESVSDAVLIHMDWFVEGVKFYE